MFIIDRDPTIDLRFRPSSRPWTSRRETKYGLAEARPSEAMAAPAGFAAASRSRRLQRVLQPAASQVGPGRLTWHQFRHIHSSLLNDLRGPAKIAQEQLGHASRLSPIVPLLSLRRAKTS